MSRLLLARKLNETICIGANVRVQVLALSSHKVRLLVEAPSGVAIDREEIRARKLTEAGFQPGEVK
jgi:carbon storage regulator